MEYITYNIIIYIKICGFFDWTTCLSKNRQHVYQKIIEYLMDKINIVTNKILKSYTTYTELRIKYDDYGIVVSFVTNEEMTMVIDGKQKLITLQDKNIIA